MGKSGLFAKMRTAKPGQGGLYFLANRGPSYDKGTTPDEFIPAKYKVRIESVKAIETRSKEDLVVIEATIVESNCPERAVGVKPSYLINMDQDAGPGNMMGFIMAVNGHDPNDSALVEEFQKEAEEVCDLACSDDQPCKGQLVDLECFMTLTKEKKNLFTVHRWTPCEQVAA